MWQKSWGIDMISYGFFDDKRAESYCKYIGEKFGSDDSTVPLKESDVLSSLDIRLGDRFVYFHFAGKCTDFSAELKVLRPRLRLFGNFIIAIKSNDTVGLSEVSEIYGEVLDYFGGNASDFSLGLVSCFGADDKIEVEVVAKTFFGADLTDRFVLERLWQRILLDKPSGCDDNFCASAMQARPVFDGTTVTVKLPSVARMMLAMSDASDNFGKLASEYTGRDYMIVIE